MSWARAISFGSVWSRPSKTYEAPEEKWWGKDQKWEKLKLWVRVDLKEHVDQLRVDPFPLDKFGYGHTKDAPGGPRARRRPR